MLESRLGGVLGLVLLVFVAFWLSVPIRGAAAQPEITVGNDFGVGARAMGMGGAFIGTANDSTALYWNPAGLSQIKQMEFYGAFSHDKLEAKTEYFGEKDSTFGSWIRPDAFDIVFPVPTYRGGLAFALGVNRLQSFDSRIRYKGFNSSTLDEDPDFGQLYVNELTDETGGIYSWDFGVAVDVARGVSIGGALSLLSGQYDYRLSLDADDTKELDLSLSGLSFDDTISSDYFGVKAKIGALVRTIDQVRIGATVEVPLDFSVDEYWSQSSLYIYDEKDDESTFDDGEIQYEISQPFRFSGGIAVRPIPGATIATDVLYTNWTKTQYNEPPAENIENSDFVSDYRGTAQIRVGMEYTIPCTGLSLRGGYLIDPLPYTPEGVDIITDRHFLSFGLGMTAGRAFSLDVAYVRGVWKQSSDEAAIKEDRNSNRIFLSVGYRF